MMESSMEHAAAEREKREKKAKRKEANKKLREKRTAERKRLFSNPNTAAKSKEQRMVSARKGAHRNSSSDPAARTEERRRKKLTKEERDLEDSKAAAEQQAAENAAAAKAKEEWLAEMRFYRDEAVKIEAELARARATKGALVFTKGALDELKTNRTLGPFKVPGTMEEWRALKDEPGLPPTSPATAVYLFCVAFAAKSILGTKPLCEAMHPACTRELLDHEIEKMLAASNKGRLGKKMTQKELLEQHPAVIRKHTMKLINAVTPIQIKKLFHGYPDNWPQLEVICDTIKFRETMADPDMRNEKYGEVPMEVVVSEEIQGDNKDEDPTFWVAWVEAKRRWFVLSWEHLPVDAEVKFGKYHVDGYAHVKRK